MLNINVKCAPKGQEKLVFQHHPRKRNKICAKYTLQGTNISRLKVALKVAGKMIFLFHRWDMLVPRRVHVKLGCEVHQGDISFIANKPGPFVIQRPLTNRGLVMFVFEIRFFGGAKEITRNPERRFLWIFFWVGLSWVKTTNGQRIEFP